MRSSPILGLVAVLGVAFLVQAGPTQSTQRTLQPEPVAAPSARADAAASQVQPEPARARGHMSPTVQGDDQ